MSRDKPVDPAAPAAPVSDVVTFIVDGKEVVGQDGSSMLNAILNAGMLIATACGGQGSCHLCRVTVEAGDELLPLPNGIEERALGNVSIAEHTRLSCQLPVRAGLRVRLPIVETPSARRARIRLARQNKGKR